MWPWRKKYSGVCRFKLTISNSCDVKTHLQGEISQDQFNALIALAGHLKHGPKGPYSDAVDKFIAEVKKENDEFWANL